MLNKLLKYGATKRTPGQGSQTYEAVAGLVRRPYIEKHVRPRQSRVAYLLRSVTTLEHFNGAAKFLRHLQHDRINLSEVVADEFVLASLRIDRPDLALHFLHRSPINRGLRDEEPLYRLFPRAKAYTTLMKAFIEKEDYSSAAQTFSIFAAQDRDFMTTKVPVAPETHGSPKSRALAFYTGMKANRLAGKLGAVQTIFDETVHRQLPVLPGAYAIIIDAVVELGDHDRADQLFAEFSQQFDGRNGTPFFNIALAHMARSHHKRNQTDIADQFMGRISEQHRQSPIIQAIERCMLEPEQQQDEHDEEQKHDDEEQQEEK